MYRRGQISWYVSQWIRSKHSSHKVRKPITLCYVKVMMSRKLTLGIEKPLNLTFWIWSSTFCKTIINKLMQVGDIVISLTSEDKIIDWSYMQCPKRWCHSRNSAGWTSQEIRKTFLSHFKERNHLHVPSSSVVPGKDDGLYFVNAGMNQVCGKKREKNS